MLSVAGLLALSGLFLAGRRVYSEVKGRPLCAAGASPLQHAEQHCTRTVLPDGYVHGLYTGYVYREAMYTPY